MKFSKVIGNIDPKLIEQAEERLSRVFLQLGTRYDNEHVGDGLGGDPLIFTLMYPVEHVCTMNIPTAGTDGKRYYWNPKFILKFPQKSLGLRIVCAHEAWHAIYMHPSRRGVRNPKLWNIAVDYIVNGTVMDDFKNRRRDGGAEFSKHLGRYMPLDSLCQLMKNPYAKIPGFEDIYSGAHDPQNPTAAEVKLPGPMEDRELTDAEKAELEKREKGAKYFYADPNLPDDMKDPERIYEMLYKLLPKCPKCGRLGMYQKPPPANSPQKGKGKGKGKKDKEEEQKGKGDKSKNKHDHEHGEGEACDCPGHGEQGDQDGDGQGQGDQEGPCDHCGDGMDIFGLGNCVDEHYDSEVSEEKMAKRISEAMEAAKKMAGHVPAALETELGKLTAPKIHWTDIIRTRLCKIKVGNQKNDWTRFRTRPMFSGLLIPKRRSNFAKIGILLDSSGSMSAEDKALGISQLQSLDEKGQADIVSADSAIYWSDMIKLKSMKAEELMKLKPRGGGGTIWASFFTDYEKHMGKCDMLVLISDLYLDDQDVANMIDPGIPVYWLCTSGHTGFKAPFGRVLSLHND